MSVNVYKPHVLVLPEDDADRQIVNGFLLDPALNLRNIQVLTPSGGWGKVLSSFNKDHINGLRKFQNRHLVLLIDFDDQVDARRAQFQAQFPDDVRDRVFLLGIRDEPEPLRKQCGDSLENIGKQLAGECYRDETKRWNHESLAHNTSERLRLRDKIKSIVFN